MARGLAIASILLVALCSCGGDETDGAPTRQEFIRRADARCAEYNQMIEDVLARADVDFADARSAAAFLAEELLPAFRDMVEDVAALEPPEGDAALIDEIIVDTEAMLEQIEQEPALALADEDPFADINRRMAEYGFVDCSGE